MWGSIDALEASLKHLHQIKYKRDLPVAQSYLNLGNAYCFVEKYEQAAIFAEKASHYSAEHCTRLKDKGLKFDQLMNVRVMS